MPIVQTQELSKTYGDFTALDRCTLQVQPGEVFGLLGPNGAGKTTLLRTLLGYLKPTSGTAQVAGYCVASQSVQVRANVAYLPGDARLPRHMRGRGVLEFFAHLHPSGCIESALKIAEQLELDIRRRVGFMSTGMRQKLALCVVLSTAAPILILDEPTANLDPTVRRAVLMHIDQARQDSRTVIFSSHVLSEIEQVCDRVVFLRRGKLVHEQAMDELKDWHRLVLGMGQREFSIPDEIKEDVRLVSQDGGEIVLESHGALAPLLDWLATLAPEDVRLEPLGVTALYERVHGFHDPQLPGGVRDAESSPSQEPAS